MAQLEINFPDGLVVYKPLVRDKTLVVGNGQQCDVQLDRRSARDVHFVVVYRDEAFRAEAAKGVSEIRVNGRNVRSARLKPDDVIEIGEYRFVVHGDSKEEVDSWNTPVVKGNEFEQVQRVLDSDRPRPKPAVAAPDAGYYVPLWKSPIVVGLGIGAGVIVVAGLVMWLLVNQMSAEKQFDAAMIDYGDGLYAPAIKRFDRFLESFPTSELAEKAKVWRALAKIKQFTEGSAPSWSNGLAAAKEGLDASTRLAFFDERIDDFGQVVGAIAVGLGTQARDAVDQAALAEGKETVDLILRSFPKDRQPKGEIDKARTIFIEAQSAIEKDDIRKQSLAAMDSALFKRDPLNVLHEHRQLYQRYPDQRSDADCLARRDAAREQLRQLVKVDRVDAEPSASDTREAPAPARTVILRDTTASTAQDGKSIPIVVADSIYAIGARTGKVHWRLPVGFEPSFLPFAPAGTNDRWLVHRTQDNSVALLDLASGTPVWRRALGAISLKWRCVPAVVRGVAYLAAIDSERGGMLVPIRVESGELLAPIRFPHRLAGTVLHDVDRDTLLVPADEDVVYVVSLKDNVCESVVPTDHEPGSLLCPPLWVGRFLFLVESKGPRQSDLRCFVVSPQDGRFTQRQVESLDGIIAFPPYIRGARIFVTTSTGQIRIYDLGGDEDAKPMTLAARTPQALELSTTQSHAFATQTRELWTVGTRLDFYALAPDVRELKSTLNLPLEGTPISQPPVQDGDVLVVTTRDPRSGRLSIRGIDTGKRNEVWRTDLAVVPDAVSPDPENPEQLLVVFGAVTQRIPATQIAVDGIVEQSLSATNANRTDTTFVGLRTLDEWRNGVLQWAGVGGSRLALYMPGERPIATALPSPMTGTPVVFGDGVVLGAENGMVYWVDPKTGKEKADPFVAPFEQGTPAKLGPVVAIDERTVAVVADDQLLRLRLVPDPFPHFEEQGRSTIPEAGSAQLAALPDRLLLVDKDQLQALATTDLTVMRRWPLGARVRRRPLGVGTAVLFNTDQNELICVQGSGEQIDISWRIQLGDNVIGNPLVADNRVWLAFADGRCSSVRLENGQIENEQTVRRSVADGPWKLGNGLVLMAPDGSLMLAGADVKSGRACCDQP